MEPRYTLYLTSTSVNAPAATARARFCIRLLTQGRQEVEVVFADRDIERANADRVVATPMLVRTAGERQLRILGIPDSVERLLRLLDGDGGLVAEAA